MPGVLGPAVNLVALAFLRIVLFFSFWPSEAAVTASSMNYCVLVVGSTIRLNVARYVIQGKSTFKGPFVDVSSGH